ncbi:MAG TPA: M20/M25/M40 family metallo-hydrolase, partial [Gemmataceae bacterium]|nr:M20/M25/M40 family metallo-hydrolase [Gemmataceae bacterium]
MKKIVDWLSANEAKLVDDLAKLVAVQSVSTDGEHQRELDQCAELTCELMRSAGLANVAILRSGASNPYAYGEWLGAPGKPTVFLYAHHDVQPVNFAGDWLSDPWTLTEREGRLFGRGSADDKGAIVVHLGAIAAYLKTAGSLPVNVKMLVEGEEEVGSKNLDAFFQEHKERLRSDVIVVCDTENIDTGVPSITYALRGIVACRVEVQSATMPVHSGMAGGMLADAALALNVILSRLYWKNGKIPIPGFYDKVRKLTPRERRAYRKLPGDEATWRKDMGVLDGV